MKGIDSVLKIVQGWVKLRGDSDGTKIGNVGDALKVVETQGIPVSTPPIVHAAGAQTKNQEDIAGFIALEVTKEYTGISCQIINERDSEWRLAWVDNVGGGEVINTIGYGYTGAGHPVSIIIPSVKKFTTGNTGTQHLRIYMKPLDQVNNAKINLSINKVS